MALGHPWLPGCPSRTERSLSPVDESWMPCPAILRALSGRPSQEGIPFSVFSGTLTPLINHVILPLLPTPTPSGHPQRSGGQGRGASVGGVPDLLWPPPDLLVPWGAAAPQPQRGREHRPLPRRQGGRAEPSPAWGCGISRRPLAPGRRTPGQSTGSPEGRGVIPSTASPELSSPCTQGGR